MSSLVVLAVTSLSMHMALLQPDGDHTHENHLHACVHAYVHACGTHLAEPLLQGQPNKDLVHFLHGAHEHEHVINADTQKDEGQQLCDRREGNAYSEAETKACSAQSLS